MSNERFEIYEGAGHRTYWRFVSPGNIIGDGGQGYVRHEDAIRGMEIIAGKFYPDHEKGLTASTDSDDMGRIGSVERIVEGEVQQIPVLRVPR